MERKDGIVAMTREQFQQYTSEAVDKVVKSGEESGGSPMTGFIIGSTAMIAFGKLEKIIFGEEEPTTEHDTETSIF